MEKCDSWLQDRKIRFINLKSADIHLFIYSIISIGHNLTARSCCMMGYNGKWHSAFFIAIFLVGDITEEEKITTLAGKSLCQKYQRRCLTKTEIINSVFKCVSEDF